jgi:tripartite ATP-independent transporter DctM subunit
MLGSIPILLLALLGAPLFLVITAIALLGFMTTGRPPADVTGEIGKLLQMDTLITIPLFTFAGYMLAESGAPRRIVTFCRALLGWMPGGMGIVTVVACAFFTTFTGASGITIVALGGLMLPMLLNQKYERQFSLGLVTTSGSRGLIFPPSLAVIIYGYVASVDITRLYIAGIVPGLVDCSLVIFMCLKAGLFNKVERYPFSPKEALQAFWKALPELLLPFWLAVLIMTAVLKVPEAAAMSALYVLIVEVLIYRDVHPFRDLPRITKESMVLCGAILVIMMASLGLTNYLVTEEVPQALFEAMRSTISSKWTFLFALNIFLLIVGCLMDIFSAILIVVPLILPLATSYGIDPVHLAMIFLFNLEVGFSTPPVGMNLFIASFRFRQPIVRLYKASAPFLGAALAAVALITYVEPLSTFTLPKEGVMIEGGLASAAPVETAKQAKPGAAKMDGLCDPLKSGDPDCEDEDEDLLEEETEKKAGGEEKKAEATPGGAKSQDSVTAKAASGEKRAAQNKAEDKAASPRQKLPPEESMLTAAAGLKGGEEGLRGGAAKGKTASRATKKRRRHKALARGKKSRKKLKAHHRRIKAKQRRHRE